jgi:hypothetical protein
MQRKRLLALGVCSFALIAGLTVEWVAGTPATALPTACPQEPLVAGEGESAMALALPCNPPPPPTTRRTTTRPPTTLPPPPPPPPAHLQSVYIGHLTGSSGSQAPIVMHVQGDSGPVYVDVTMGDGLHVDCHGDQSVGMLRFAMSGTRSGSSVSLSRSMTTEFSGESVDLTFSTNATLSADGLGLSGPVHLHAGLDFPLTDCDLDWAFQARSMTPQDAPSLRTVPNIVGLPFAQAMGALGAAGLVGGNQNQVMQLDCGDGVGRILGQSPGAGAQLPAGGAVNYSIGVMPAPPYQCA